MPPIRKKQLNLRDLHDLRKLAEFMEWPWVEEKTYVVKGEKPGYSNHGLMTPEEATAWRWKDYLQRTLVGHPSAYKPQTYTQFKQECLKSIGLTKGSVKERIARAVFRYPDLYTEPGHAPHQ